jgi:hypothetical protein
VFGKFDSRDEELAHGRGEGAPLCVCSDQLAGGRVGEQPADEGFDLWRRGADDSPRQVGGDGPISGEDRRLQIASQ